MKTLVLGSGGREHAIAWKLKQNCNEVFLHPGNDGAMGQGFIPLGSAQSLPEIIRAAKSQQIELVVIGSENLLALDYATELRNNGFLVIGPDQNSAQLETSKVFAKQFMVRAKVPTASFTVVHDPDGLEQSLKGTLYPKVLKLDGLAAGKGVVIAQNLAEAMAFGDRIWHQLEFGPRPQALLVEEYIPGVELSYLGLCDGKTFTPLSSATDFKRIFDRDEGPNTGGMGAMSPSPYLNAPLENRIAAQIVQPILKQLQAENFDYRGILYIGIMIDAKGEPYVLEFNTRFGDPETQALMLRIEGSFVPHLVATAQGKLGSLGPLRWKNESAVFVVAAAEGYPGKPKTGSPISGFQNPLKETQLFFAGVKSQGNDLVTNGGRVLGVGALGLTLEVARKRAYAGLAQIHFSGMQYRKDIGTIKENNT